jgi:outer membrane biosynthesis protein TonB
MRNNLTACDGPLTATAAPISRGGSRRRRIARGLLALPLALALIAPGATAWAAEPTSGYSQTTPAPKSETTPAPKSETTPAPKSETTPAPKQETAPTSTSTTPASETEPARTSNEPTATTAVKAKTLPFTGLDLRWVTIGGLLLVGMGMSIVVTQRRRPGAGR